MQSPIRTDTGHGPPGKSQSGSAGNGRFKGLKPISLQGIRHPVAGLNSTIRLKDIDSGETFCFRIVSSIAPAPGLDHVMVGSPLGDALVGQASGSIVHWKGPSRLRRFKVTSVS